VQKKSVLKTRQTSPWRVAIVCLVSFTLFAALGVAATVVIAAKVLLPIAAKGFGEIVGAIAAAAAESTKEVLHHGDSAQRLTLLTQLKESFATADLKEIDPQVAEWFRPGLEECGKDEDPNVVALAVELLALLGQPVPDS